MRPLSPPAQFDAAARPVSDSASWSALARSGIILWVVVAAVWGLVSALAITTAASLWPIVPGNTVTPERERFGIALNVALIALACTLSIIVGQWSPRLWRRALGVATGLPLLITATASGRLVACAVFAVLPLLFFIHPRRLVLITLGGIVTALALWFLTAQYLRYTLSIITLLCPFAGAGYVAADRSLRVHAGRAVFRADEQTILAQLAAGQFSHILVARQGYSEALAAMPVFGQDFLSRHTILLGGDQRGYLYRIVPSEQQGASAWTEGEELLQALRRGGEVSLLDTEVGQTAHTTVGAERRYLFHYTARATGTDDGQLLVTIAWRDADGRPLGTVTQSGRTIPGDARGDLMVVRAPEHAARAAITVRATRGEALLSDPSFRLLAAR